MMRWLDRWKKQWVLNLNEFRRRCDECYSYAESKYTRCVMTLPGDREKKETFFFAMCRHHQEDFPQIHLTLQ